MAAFCERPVIPEMAVHVINKDSTLGNPIPGETTSKKGMIREVEVGFVIDRETAQNLITWLQDKIDVASGPRRSLQGCQRFVSWLPRRRITGYSLLSWLPASPA